MAGHLDRHRASSFMQEQGLAALVLAQPESISYATGAFAGVASYWRRAGAAFVLVPADPGAPMAAIVGDLQAASFCIQSGIADVRSHRIWVETDQFPSVELAKPKRTPRPAQYDLQISLRLLQDLLAERNLLQGKVGLELGFIPVADYPNFHVLPIAWTDCTRIVERLRAVKSQAEILKLRHAAEFAGAGIEILKQSIATGMTAEEMVSIWRSGAIDCARHRHLSPPQSTWAYISVGGDGFAPGGPARSGDIIKIDVGCVVEGYSSDGARTAVLGKPGAKARNVFDALHRAFDVGFALLKPDMPLKEIYHATVSSMWNDGFETYGRGHFGHGVGASIWSEEWPFISADASTVLEPGMVMAFETPWYIDGLGGFIIEDQVLITDTGCEIMAPIPRDLFCI